jgi:hypothetical protein
MSGWGPKLKAGPGGVDATLDGQAIKRLRWGAGEVWRSTSMGIGLGIFFIATGAILTFAVNARVSGLNIAVVGVILMVAGVLGIVLDLFMFAPRRRRSSVTYGADGAPTVRQTTITDKEGY